MVKNKFYYSQVSLKTSKVGGITVNVQEAAADRHPVLYDNFYLVKHLLDEKGQIYTSCKLQIIYK